MSDTEQQWPDEAIEAIKAELRNAHLSLNHLAERLLITLEPHAVPRSDEWEWGVRGPVRVAPIGAETARQVVADPLLNDEGNLTVVRRRPAGPWEVAPDA